MVVAQIQKKIQEIDLKVKTWVATQPAHVEVAVVTVASALQGAGIGALMGSLTSDMAANVTPPPGQGVTPEVASTMKQMQVCSAGRVVSCVTLCKSLVLVKITW